MQRMIPLSIVLLLVVQLGSPVWAQDSSGVITVTGMYLSSPYGEYQEILTPCNKFEVWDLRATGPAFTALAQVYAGVDGRYLSDSGRLFVELKGRYRAYEDKAHTDGLFEVTEVVRYSTSPADIEACAWTCERAHGANSPICLAQVDGQCGSRRNSCVSGLDSTRGMADTATEYRWECLGLSGGDNVFCTAPKRAGRPIAGVCGSRRNSCTAGTANAGAVADTATHYRWVCAGAHGGADSGTCTAAKQAGGHPVGHWDYCSSSQPCGVGQGDCDNDRECRPGLRCVDNVQGRYGLSTAIDVCEAPFTAASAGTLVWTGSAAPVVGQPYTVKWASRP